MRVDLFTHQLGSMASPVTPVGRARDHTLTEQELHQLSYRSTWASARAGVLSETPISLVGNPLNYSPTIAVVPIYGVVVSPSTK